MDIQQSLLVQLINLVEKQKLKNELKRLESIIQEEHLSELYERSLTLYICLFGANFHQTLVSTFFTLCVGILFAKQVKAPLLEKQFVKLFHELVAFEKEKVGIARSFKNLDAVSDEIEKTLNAEESLYTKMFTVVLLLIPQSDQLLIDELLELAGTLEEQRHLMQVQEYILLVLEEKESTHRLYGSTEVQKRIKELMVLANFGRRNSPIKNYTLQQAVNLFGLVPYYEQLIQKNTIVISEQWNTILDYFEDFPKSKIRIEYLAVFGKQIGIRKV